MTTAVFDLDETLTRRDTFLPFVWGFLRRRPGRLWRLLPLALRLTGLVLDPRSDTAVTDVTRIRRTRVKRAVLLACVGGVGRDELADWAERFADRVNHAELRPGSLAALRAHQEASDRVVLATASFDIYAVPLARRLGIDEVICSHIAWDAADRVAGMDGGNCRDEEKLRQVKALLGPAGDDVVAYSDSHADLPLLAWAGHGVAVSPTPRLAAAAPDLGLAVRQW